MKNILLLITASIVMLVTSCTRDMALQEKPTQNTETPGEKAILDIDEAEQQRLINEQSAGNQAFAFNLYNKTATTKENFFFSPYSISSALAMTRAGADGTTATEMDTALSYSLAGEDLHKSFYVLDGLLMTQDPGLKFTVANSIWQQQDFKVLDEFLNLTQKYYGSAVYPTDFKNALEESRQKINQWIEMNTNKMITDMVKPGILKKITKLVLVNANHFKGAWLYEFDKAKTKTHSFALLNGSDVNVEMMVHGGDNEELDTKFRYARNEHSRMLELPYKDKNTVMFVVMPRRYDASFADWSQNFSQQELNELAGKLADWSFNQIVIPKFTVETTLDLAKSLKALGMKEAFENSANFSKMTTEVGLKIGQVLHQAKVEVSEAGTEAAASTVVNMVLESAGLDDAFYANRPFMFLIFNKKTNSILFMGHVVNPKS